MHPESARRKEFFLPNPCHAAGRKRFAEIFYAAAMPKTDGFTRIGPSVSSLLFIGVSMYILSLATRTIPIGTAYAVWVGIGVVGTAA